MQRTIRDRLTRRNGNNGPDTVRRQVRTFEPFPCTFPKEDAVERRRADWGCSAAIVVDFGLGEERVSKGRRSARGFGTPLRQPAGGLACPPVKVVGTLCSIEALREWAAKTGAGPCPL